VCFLGFVVKKEKCWAAKFGIFCFEKRQPDSTEEGGLDEYLTLN